MTFFYALGRRFSAAVVLPLAVVVASAAAATEPVLCQAEGIGHSSCCCPHEIATPTATAIETAACCETVTVTLESHAASSIEQRTVHQPPLAAVVALTPRFAAAVEERLPQRSIRDDRRREATGQLLFLLHRALLI